MALINPIDIAGITLSDGYWRITDFYWNDSEPYFITIRLNAYANQNTHQEKQGAIKGEEIKLNISPLTDAHIENLITELMENNDLPTLKTFCFNLIRTVAYMEAKQQEPFLNSQDA